MVANEVTDNLVTPTPGQVSKPVGRIRWRRLALACALLALLVMVFAPTVFGSRLVFQSLLNRLKTGSFALTVESIELRWLSPLIISGITITDNENPRVPAIAIDQIAGDRGLLSLLFHGGDLGTWTIGNTQVDLTLLEADGRFRNLLTALGQPDSASVSKPERGKSPANFHASIFLTNTEVIVRKRHADAPLVVVPAFDLQATYAIEENSPVISVAATRLLDDVKLTPELVRAGLAYAAPLLAQATWVDGRVTVEVEPVRVPLATPLLSSGYARVRLDAVRLGVNNQEILSAMERAAKALGREAVNELVVLNGTVIHLTMGDGKVHHEGLKFGLPQIDSRLQISSAGSVGLQDRSLDLLIDIPIPLEYIAGRDAVHQLGIPTVTLPVQGHLGQPTLSWKPFRQDIAKVFGNIASQVSDEAPAVSAIMSAVSSVSSGDADQAIMAAAGAIEGLSKFFQQQRQQRQSSRQPEAESAAGEASQKPQVDGAGQDDASQRPRNRPVLDRLRQRRESRQ